MCTNDDNDITEVVLCNTSRMLSPWPPLFLESAELPDPCPGDFLPL